MGYRCKKNCKAHKTHVITCAFLIVTFRPHCKLSLLIPSIHTVVDFSPVGNLKTPPVYSFITTAIPAINMDVDKGLDATIDSDSKANVPVVDEQRQAQTQKIRTENRERKKRWREANEDRSKFTTRLENCS